MEPGKNIINWDNVFKQSQSFKNNEPFMFGFVEEFIQQEFYEKLFETYPKLDDMLDLTRFMRSTFFPGKDGPYFYNKSGEKIKLSYEGIV